MKELLMEIFNFYSEYLEEIAITTLIICLFAGTFIVIPELINKLDQRHEILQKSAEIDSLKEVIHKFENKQAVFIGRKDHIVQEVSEFMKDPYSTGCCLIIK